jgi:hypothetical protein
MTEFNLKQEFISYGGFFASEDDPDTLFKPNGISARFYCTSDGVSMFNVVDTSKPKYKWMHFRFRVDHINSWDDVLFLLQGSTVKGF